MIATTPAEAILDRLDGVTGRDGQWQARCPVHDDNRASLSIAKGDDGRVLLHCQAGCTLDDILSERRDLFSSSNGAVKNGRAKTIAATYDYQNANGELVFQALRFEPKDFRQRRPDSKGGWIWSVKGCEVLPYKLPELLSEADATIFVVEGEKDADNLASIGLITTCCSGGAGKWKPEHTKYLAGRDIVVLPDNDGPGRKHAQQVARSLAGIARSIKVVELPKGDVSDWIDAHGDAATPEIITEHLLQILEEVKEWSGGTDPLPAHGTTVAISNYDEIEAEGERGRKETEIVPKSLPEIIDNINRLRDHWPRRVDNVLFVDDPQHGIDWFDRRTTSGLFGWLRRHGQVDWKSGGRLVSQAELFAELERTAEKYSAIETYPHEPPLAGHYYRCKPPVAGDGGALRQLLDCFRPATTVDRDLIQSAIMTVFWGGPSGCRPAFVITADAGRGVGKTKLAEAIAFLAGGFIDVSAGEDIGTLKQRFLSPEGQSKRVAFLDNVKSLRFSWAELESLITTPIISGKRMYVGEGQRPNTVTWLMTLNGVSLATDLAQRSVIIKLSKGKNDGPWYENTIRFIDENRNAIIGDIIAALQSEQNAPAEYTRWAAWEQAVLSRLPEPEEAQRVILDRQNEANCEQDEAEIIEEHFAEQLKRLGYDSDRSQVRIPVAVAARWYGWAVGEKTKTTAASKKINQMANENQLQKIAPDPSRTHGRCFVWTGEHADINDAIECDLVQRIAKEREEK